MDKIAITRLTRRAILAGLAAGPSFIGRAAIARPGDVVILTSFPPSLYEPFRLAFEREEPGIRVRFINRKTTAALAMMEDGAEVDLFWASSPDAFEVLKAKGDLLPMDATAVTPGTHIQGYPIDDPDGFFRGFTVSGYGLSWNQSRLEQSRVAPPDSIADLANPVYRGLIAMSAPSRSGTTHLMVETILQQYGWEKGWKLWLAIAANLANVAARSFSVASGVVQGRYGIGLSIDFIGRGGKTDSGIGFKYPSENIFLPASIAHVRRGRNPESARRFARFVLSDAGQCLLLLPSIQRQPVLPKVVAEMATPLLSQGNPVRSGPRFDARLSGRRYELVNLLFDELVTERLLSIQRFWRNANEIAPLAALMPGATEELAAITRLTAQPPEAVLELADHEAVPKLRRVPRGTPMPPEQARLVEMIRTSVESQWRDVETRLDQLGNRLSPSGTLVLPRRLP